jgi:hypothetical protein
LGAKRTFSTARLTSEGDLRGSNARPPFRLAAVLFRISEV